MVAASVHWNLTYVADAVAHLLANGETVPTKMLTWEHIGFSGNVLF